MNTKIIFHGQEYAGLDEMTPEVRREYCTRVAQFARIPPPTEAHSIVSWIHDPL